MHGTMENLIPDALAVPEIQNRLETVQRLPNNNHQISVVESRVKANGRATLEGEGICEKHAAVMDPKLWRNLPEEVVELVFSHLTARDITALQLVSKGWKSALSTTPNFQKLCQQASGNMFATMRWNRSKMNYTYHIFDYNANRWRSSLCSRFTSSIDVSYRDSTIVHGGGLVWFVPQHNANARRSLPIVVYNPLTSVWRELPLQSLHGKETVMSQLLIDKVNMSYKLMIVCSLQGILKAECYNSSVGTWSKMHEGFISGPSHPLELVEDLCTFDCAQGTMTEMICFGPLTLSEYDLECSYLLQDRVFVLKQNQEAGQAVQLLNERGEEVDTDVDRNCGSGYKLVEFQVDTSRLELKERKSYGFPTHPFKDEICALAFFVCNNFIMVIAARTINTDCRKLGWVYDMSKDVWRVLPSLPVNAKTDHDLGICELRWDTIP